MNPLILKDSARINGRDARASDASPSSAAGADVLAKATVRAASLLGLNGATLARVIGVSEPTVSRLLRGDRPLAPASKEGELAALLVRVYRSLDALVGTDDGKRRTWIDSYNEALNAVPKELIQTVEGLVATLHYLDSMRAPA